jgi:hypothetical protein
VVAFRGTEQVKWKDIVSDLNLIPTALDEERTGTVDLGIGSIPMPFATFRKSKRGVRDGVYTNALLQSFGEVRGIFAEQEQQKKQGEQNKLSCMCI